MKLCTEEVFLFLMCNFNLLLKLLIIVNLDWINASSRTYLDGKFIVLKGLTYLILILIYYADISIIWKVFPII